MKRSVIIATAIGATALIWVASGFLRSKDQSTANEQTTIIEQKILPKVRVALKQAESRINEVQVNGRTEPLRSVELRAEVDGRVEKILVQEGQKVTTGQPLIELDKRDRGEAVREASARLKQRRIEYSAAKQLAGKGYNSEIRLAEAKTALEEAKSDLRRAEINLANSTIKAPFDGILNSLPAENGDYISPGTSIASVVDLSKVKLVGYVTEKKITHVHPNSVGHAQFLEGKEEEGRISYVSKTAEGATRTFRIELTLDNPEGDLVGGLTAKMRIPLDEMKAHLVPLSSLTLDDQGTIGIKGIDAQNRVIFMPVTVLMDTHEGIWLAGLPDEFTMITVGQEFVTPGQEVEPKFPNAARKQESDRS